MNLENLNLVELNAQELQEIEGGNIFRMVNYLLDVAAVYDAMDDFRQGWNSVSGRQVSSGGW